MRVKEVKLDSSRTLKVLDSETNKRAMIFLHGLTGNYHQLQFFYNDENLKRNYRMIALDFRGRGDSSKAEPSSSIHQHAQDIIDLIQSMYLENPILVGYSMGGYVASIVASKIKVDKLIILDGAATADDYQDLIVVPTFSRLSNQYDSQEAYIEMVTTNYSKMGVPYSDELENAVKYEVQEKTDSWYNKADEQTIRSDWASLRDFDILEVGSKINNPVLLIQCLGSVGSVGPLFKDEHYVETKKAFNNLQVVQSDSNHYTLVFDNQEEIKKKIDEFLEGNKYE